MGETYFINTFGLLARRIIAPRPPRDSCLWYVFYGMHCPCERGADRKIGERSTFVEGAVSYPLHSEALLVSTGFAAQVPFCLVCRQASMLSHPVAQLIWASSRMSKGFHQDKYPVRLICMCCFLRPA